jgi:two-component system, OmpR family, sensor kinase
MVDVELPAPRGRPRSLQRRLLLTTATVVCVALVIADVATYLSLRSFLVNRVDSSLDTAEHSLEHVLLSPEERADPTRADDAFAAVVAGAYIELRDKPGHVLLTGSARRAFATVRPRYPARITGLTKPGAVRYFDVGAVGGRTTFRVRAQRTADGGTLLVALSLDDVAHTLRTLLAIELVVTLAALVAAIGLGVWLVSLGMRPLRVIEATAARIAGGDLTQRVPADPRTEVGRLGTALNGMLQRIEDAFRRRTESEERLKLFVADASHELRTPVSAVAAYAELFERGARDRPDDLERAMQGIRRETDRLSTLIDELLVLARLDGEGLRRRERVDLVALTGEALQSALVLGPGWPLTMSAPRPVEVIGDPIALRQIIDNLLANVRGHTSPGTEGRVQVFASGDEIVLEVADDGPGLTAGEAERVFERFYRADPSRRRAHGGTGLGLAVVAALARAHGARTELDTEPGSGATFRVIFPAPPPA